MGNKWINTKDQLPDKGKDIIGISLNDDRKHYIYRCSCHNLNCKEWRCSLTGYGLMLINIDKWKYVN